MRRFVSLPALGVLLLLGIVCVGVAVWLTSRSLTNPSDYHQPDPQGFRFTETPASRAGLEYEDVSFSVSNGATVRGWLVPAVGDNKDIAVVAVHGRSGDRRAMLRHLSMLHDLGAGVLLIDLRENGLSDGQGRGTGLGVREAEDASAAARELRKRGYGKVVVFGCSLGGSAAIIAAAQERAIDGVISESAIADFATYVADEADTRLRRFGLKARWLTEAWGRAVVDATTWRIGLSSYAVPEDVIGHIAPRPVLLIHALRDPWVVKGHADSLAHRGGSNVSLWQIDGEGHCDGFDVAAPEYRARVAAFFAKLKAADAMGD